MRYVRDIDKLKKNQYIYKASLILFLVNGLIQTHTIPADLSLSKSSKAEKAVHPIIGTGLRLCNLASSRIALVA